MCGIGLLIIFSQINAFFGYKVVDNIKLNTFDGFVNKVKDKKSINATKNKHIKKIRNIKNDKIKNSLLELTKHFKQK